jgi:hypothetical protein
MDASNDRRRTTNQQGEEDDHRHLDGAPVRDSNKQVSGDLLLLAVQGRGRASLTGSAFWPLADVWSREVVVVVLVVEVFNLPEDSPSSSC